MKIILIRHFETKGNFEKRYVGNTDEEIVYGCYDIEYPWADIVFASPLKRCVQTAEKIYKGNVIYIEEGLRETDFGDFEYKNFNELKKNSYYIKWLESGGRMSFPNGESVEMFIERAVKAFVKCLRRAEKKGCEAAAFIVHGGTIMAVLSHYLNKDFYEFHIKNGCGYICEYSSGLIKITGEING